MILTKPQETKKNANKVQNAHIFIKRQENKTVPRAALAILAAIERVLRTGQSRTPFKEGLQS